jgi:hypothetical protein
MRRSRSLAGRLGRGLVAASIAAAISVLAAGLEPASAAGLEPASAAGLEPASAAGLEPASAAGLEPASFAGSEQVASFGSNRGNLIMYAYPARRTAGRRVLARLHPERRRLLHQLRPAQVCRPAAPDPAVLP